MSPRSGPRRPQVAIRLGAEQAEALDEIAETTGVTRSDVIRDAITQYLNRREALSPPPGFALEYDEALHLPAWVQAIRDRYRGENKPSA